MVDDQPINNSDMDRQVINGIDHGNTHETRTRVGMFPLALLPDVLDSLEAHSFIGEEEWCYPLTRDFKNFALVHREWTAMCQVRLKHHIRLHPCWRNREYELREWGGLGTHNIGPSTRSLALVCGCFTARCVCENKYRTLVAAAPNLRILLLGRIMHRSSDYLQHLGLLRAIGTLTQLTFIAINIRYDEHLPRLFEMLNGLPRLETLSLSAYTPGDEDVAILQSMPPRKFPMTSLRLHQSNSIFPFALLEWLLRPSSAAPRSSVFELKISASPGSRFITLLRPGPDIDDMATHFTSLNRLKMIGWTMKYEVIRGQILSKCTSLQSLFVDIDLSPPITPRFRSSAQYYAFFAESLPPSLQTLALDISSLDTLDPPWTDGLIKFDEAISVAIRDRLASLSRVDFVLRIASKKVMPLVSKIRDACATRSIALKFGVRGRELDAREGEDIWVF